MFGWWNRRNMAKVADRQRRWILKRIEAYASECYDQPPNDDLHQVGYALIRFMAELPPPDFK